MAGVAFRVPGRPGGALRSLRGGADLREIQILLGHASLSSTEVYLGVEVSDLDRMIERSHPRERKDDVD